MNDTTADTITQLMRQIEVLRNALQGRTMSCSQCNYMAKRHDEICEAVRDFAAQERLFAARASVRTDVTYGDERPRLWRRTFRKLCQMVNVLP